MRPPRSAALILAFACLGIADTCGSASGPGEALALGTWGGDNAGAIVDESAMHLHIGCTLGDAPRPTLKFPGRFEVLGEYNVDAYPVNLGEVHPARFSGTVVGRVMRVTVVLTDIDRTIGPVEVTLGKEPQMGPCPICRTPGEGAEPR
jgi:hypothetical protein